MKIGTKVKLINCTGRDSYLNGMTGTIVEAYDLEDCIQGVGFKPDDVSKSPYGVKFNVRKTEIEII